MSNEIDILKNQWVEKYRPKELEDIVGQESSIHILQNFAKRKSIPNLIFTGSAGTGKTTCARAFIRKVYANQNLDIENYEFNVFERNASDEMRMSKGDVDELKNFVYNKGFSGEDTIKVVILDECDNVSKDVQNALRRIMETSKNVVYIFMNNYFENLIDPIISRCAILRFYPVSRDACIKRMKYILKCENISLSDENIGVICEICDGDMRQCINVIQIISRFKMNDPSFDIHHYFGTFNKDELVNLFDLILNSRWSNILELLNSIDFDIFPRNFLTYLMMFILLNKKIEKYAMHFILMISDIDKRITNGGDPMIQLKTLFAHFAEISKSMEG